jgi:autotransporter-associated beta strand protein
LPRSKTSPAAPNALASFAVAVADAVHGPQGTTAYTYETETLGTDQAPIVDLGGTAPTVLTDCSGWVSFALASVAPIHQAIAAAEQQDPIFNPGHPIEAYNPADPSAPIPIDLAEAGWPWPRAEVLTHLFATADRHDGGGFNPVNNFAKLQAGDIIAYSLGIYSDPANPDSGSTPGLVTKGDTGHTMIVVGAPVLVPTALAAAPTLSSQVVAVYAVPVVDSSGVPHFGDLSGFTQPLTDDRHYASLPEGLSSPQYVAGGLGTGTLWFGVDAKGHAIQYRFGEYDPYFPSTATAEDPTADATTIIAAARPANHITLAGSMLNTDGQLVVEVYPNAAPGFGGTAMMTEDLNGAGGLLVTGGGTLVLDGANAFTGGITLAAGSTLALDHARSAGTGAITFAADGSDATLRLEDGVAIRNTIHGFAPGDTIDLVGVEVTALRFGHANVLRLSGAEGESLALRFAPGTVPEGYAFTATGDGAGGTLVSLAPEPVAPSAAHPDQLWA